MNRETKAFGITYLTVWVLLMAHCICRFCMNWEYMTRDIGMYLIFPMAVHCVWLIPGIKKTTAKKEQKNSIIILFVLFAVTMVCCIIFSQLCKLIMLARAGS